MMLLWIESIGFDDTADATDTETLSATYDEVGGATYLPMLPAAHAIREATETEER